MRKVYTTLNVLVLLSTFLVSTACSEQLGGAKGKVIDGLTGLPIVGAEVVATTKTDIESEQRYKKFTTKTGKDGSFQIKGLRDKAYEIRVFKKDYTMLATSDVITIPEKSNLLMEDITLLPIPLQLFVFSDLIAKDALTGLIWTKNGSMGADTMNWDEANDFIKQLNEKRFAGYANWRLPTLNELRTLWQKSINYCNNIKSERDRKAAKWRMCNDAREFLRWLGFEIEYRCWTSEENGKKATSVSLSNGDGYDQSGWNPDNMDKDNKHWCKVWPVRSDK